MTHIHDMVDHVSYMAHGYCLLWLPWLISLHVVSDALIAIAYTAIPLAILWFMHKRSLRGAQVLSLGYWFVAFIFLCGLTHVVDILTLWFPIYETQGYLKAITAFVSTITAIIIWPLFVLALKIPTPDEYENVQRELEASNDNLEQKIKDRTAALDVMTLEVAHRSKNLLAVVQGLVKISKKCTDDPTEFVENLDDRLICLASIHNMLVEGEWKGVCIKNLITGQLAPFGLRASLDGPTLSLSPTEAQYLALSIHELGTNSLKHAGGKGKYQISWKANPFNFTWKEEHPDLTINKPKRRGFGLQLLEQIVPMCFSAKATLEFEAHSITYSISERSLDMASAV